MAMIAPTPDIEPILYTDPQITITKTQAVIRGTTYVLTEDTTVEFLDRQGNYVVGCVLSMLGAMSMLCFGITLAESISHSTYFRPIDVECLSIGLLTIAIAIVLVRRTKSLYMIKIRIPVQQADEIGSDDLKSRSPEVARIESNDREYLYPINKVLREAINGLR
jgi:hypothetical protein